MKAYDISLFSFCLAAAIALLGPTGIFTGGPGGTDLVTAYVVAGLITALSLGGVSIFGYSFKLTAALSAFALMYAGSSAMALTLLWQFLPFAEAHYIVAVITAIFVFIGIWAALQIAAGPMQPGE